MKKRIILIAISMVLLLSCLTGCDTRLYPDGMEYHEFNYEVIGEMVENYITEKYGIDCELITGYSATYAGERYALAEFKTPDDDNTYTVTVYPETDEDTDGDGYYDSYYIYNETYYQQFVSPMSSEWAEQLVSENTDYTNYKVFACLWYVNYCHEAVTPDSIEYILNKGKETEGIIYLLLSEENCLENQDFSIETEKLVSSLEGFDIQYELIVYVYNKENFEKASQIKTYYDYQNNLRKYNVIYRFNAKN